MPLSITPLEIMGTPLLPVRDGVPCPVCWGPAKAFGDIATPNVIKLELTSLLPGEFSTPALQTLLLQTHWLDQQGFPCSYAINDGTLIWVVFWTIASTQIDVFTVADGRAAFRKGTVEECAVDLPSELTSPAGVVAWNGFANITFV